MAKESLLVRDLSKFYRDRLQRITDDVADNAVRSHVPNDEIAALIIRNLAGICAVIVIETGGTKEDFINACEGIYDVMKNQLQRGKRPYD